MHLHDIRWPWICRRHKHNHRDPWKPTSPNKKLHLFSKYTGLELETSKCGATWALWGYGNPMSKANINLLINQINTIIKFEDGTNIKYLPPNKSYKMLGVQINPMLDFRDHLQHITTQVRKLARVLTKRKTREKQHHHNADLPRTALHHPSHR